MRFLNMLMLVLVLAVAALALPRGALATNQPFGLALGVAQSQYDHGAATFQSDTEPFVSGLFSATKHLGASATLRYQLNHGNAVGAGYVNYNLHSQGKISVGAFVGRRWPSEAEAGISEWVLGPSLGYDLHPSWIVNFSSAMGLDSGGACHSLSLIYAAVKPHSDGGDR